MPKIEMIEVHKLKKDGDNPNVMLPHIFNALKKNMQKYGFLVPIVTNKNLVIADGEHRLKAAMELGMKKVAVIKLDVEEVDRKILRQVLNKLKGNHNPTGDKFEFQFILDNDGKEDLKDLLAITDEDIDKMMFERSLSDDVPPITAEYLEAYNYVLVFFRNQLDWNVAQEKLNLPTVRTNEPEGKFKKSRKGVGRVIEGSDFLRLLK